MGCCGFSWNAAILVGSFASTSITPNWFASAIGWRMAATVTPAPDAMCASTIWAKSMRYTWSAPTTTTMSGFSSRSRLRLCRIASAEPLNHRLPSRCCAGTDAT